MRKKRRLKFGSHQAPSAKPVSLAPPPWDMGADGPANRAGLVEEEATDMDAETGKPVPNPNGVRRKRRVDMLEVWHRRGTISTAGFNAGEILRDAFHRTQMGASINLVQDRVDSSPKPDHAVAIQVDRISAYSAITKLIAPQDRDILDTCVVHGHSPAKLITREGKRPYYGAGHAAGLIHVRDALDRLARKMGA